MSENYIVNYFYIERMSLVRFVQLVRMKQQNIMRFRFLSRAILDETLTKLYRKIDAPKRQRSTKYSRKIVKMPHKS